MLALVFAFDIFYVILASRFYKKVKVVMFEIEIFNPKEARRENGRSAPRILENHLKIGAPGRARG